MAMAPISSFVLAASARRTMRTARQPSSGRRTRVACGSARVRRRCGPLALSATRGREPPIRRRRAASDNCDQALGSARRTVAAAVRNDLAVAQPRGLPNLAPQICTGVFQHGLKYRLQFARRTGDDPQHLGGGGLCCKGFSRSSFSSRVFSMAITAWAAKFSTSSICLSVKGAPPGGRWRWRRPPRPP